MFPDGFWSSPIWKEAARAGLRQISQMVGQGNLAGASRLATTPGVLKPSLAGSQIQHLGRGGEGLATMVAHPEHGVAVRKLYDPRGLSGPEMIARKEQAGKALGNSPNFSQFLGSAKTPSGGQMHFNEYIPSGQAPTGQAGAQSVKHTRAQALQDLTAAGYSGGKDIRKGNMIYDEKAGQHRVIDYLPSKPGEFMRMPQDKERMLAPTPGSSPLNQDYNPQKADETGGMLRRLIGGKSQPGGQRRGVPAMANTVPAGQPSGNQTVARSPGALAKGTPPMQPMQPQKPVMAPTTPYAAPSNEKTTPLQPVGQSGAATSVLNKPFSPAAVTAPIKKPSPISI